MWEDFFYYDSVPVEQMNAKDINAISMQPKGTLFYNRSYGIDSKFNFPQAGFNAMLVAYSIANAIAFRNQNVVDGQNGFQDRRVAVSQNFINVVDNKNGERDVMIYYFNYKNYESIENTSVVVK